MKVEFYKHSLSEQDIANSTDVLRSLFLTTGKVVDDFEQKFAQFLGAKHAVATNSCTNSLFLALKCAGVLPGDEVITTPMSFVVSSNAIERCGAKPVFVDVEDFTGNINVDLIEAAITENTAAIVPVHLYGQMCDMVAIKKLADKYQLKIIEDACHAIEAKRDNIRPGELSDFACFSFYATKNLTSGEGGCIVTNNDKSAKWLQQARLHGIDKSAYDRHDKSFQHYDMKFLGYKCNMSNINAALLVNQIDGLRNRLQIRDAIANMYDEAFEEHPLLAIPAVLKNSLHARHIYTIWVPPIIRDKLLVALKENGVGCAVNYRAIHLMGYYQKKYGYKRGDFPVAEAIGDATITLPFYPSLKDDEIEYVIEVVDELILALAEEHGL